jgi:hypothetical protein
MRCLSCDRELTDYESTKKSIFSGDYVQLCQWCLADTDCIALGNPALMTDADDDLLDLLEDNAVDFDDWRHDSED